MIVPAGRGRGQNVAALIVTVVHDPVDDAAAIPQHNIRHVVADDIARSVG
jgi:hypothetical protein